MNDSKICGIHKIGHSKMAPSEPRVTHHDLKFRLFWRYIPVFFLPNRNDKSNILINRDIAIYIIAVFTENKFSENPASMFRYQFKSDMSALGS